MKHKEMNNADSPIDIPEKFVPKDELDELLVEVGKYMVAQSKNRKIDEYELDPHQMQKYNAVRGACLRFAELNNGSVNDAVVLPTEPYACIELKMPLGICNVYKKK